MPKGCYYRAPIEERFWNFVMPEPNSGCWLWTGDANNLGYGWIATVTGYKRDRVKAHRLSWELHHGPIPDGLFVCHRCDLPCCVNPDHLFLGTNSDNMKDCIRKVRHNRAKLSPKQVIELRAARNDGATYSELSRRFSITVLSVGKIVNYQAHADVP